MISDNDGCISWRDTVDFNFLAPECQLVKDITISNASLGLSQTSTLYINPWSAASLIVQVPKSINAGNSKNSVPAICMQKKTSLTLDTMKYSFNLNENGFSYQIDDFLNLTEQKSGLLGLSVKVQRESFSDPNGMSNPPAPVGFYLLRYAVVDQFVSDPSMAIGGIYTARKKVIQMKSPGTISESIVLESANIKAFGSTNKIYFEVLPLQENAGEILKVHPEADPETLVQSPDLLNVITYSGPIMMGNNNESNELTPAFEGGKSVVNSLIWQKANQDRMVALSQGNLAKKEVFAQIHNLKILDLNNIQQISSSLGDAKDHNYLGFVGFIKVKDQQTVNPKDSSLIKKWYETGEVDLGLGMKLCHAWFYNNLQKPTGVKQVIPFSASFYSGALADQCTAALIKGKFSDFFDTHARYFVKKPTSYNVIGGDFHELTVTSAFSMSRGISNNTTMSIGMEMSSSLVLRPLEFLNGGTGMKMGFSKSQTDSKSFGNTFTLGASTTMTLEHLVTNITVPEVEKCVVIQLNANLYASKDSQLQKIFSNQLTDQEKFDLGRSGYMICGGVKKTNVQLTEDYYVLNQRMSSQGQMNNFGSDSSRPFYAAIRGAYNLGSFLSYMQTAYDIPNSVYGKFQVQEMNDDRLKAFFLRSFETYPGQVVRGR